MKKSRIALFIILFTLIQVTPLLVHATAPVSEYKLLAPLDTGDGQKLDSTDLVTYLKNIYMFLVAFSSVLAIFMIVLGGFQYMSTDAIGGKKEGLEKIRNAVYGFLLVLSSWLILYTINPKFIEIKFFQ